MYFFKTLDGYVASSKVSQRLMSLTFFYQEGWQHMYIILFPVWAGFNCMDWNTLIN